MYKRIMFYSHDTFGLGHIRRTQKIANALAGAGRSILIACSSPLANSFSSAPGIEYLHLPGFTKQWNGEYRPRSLQLPMDKFVELRASLLLAAAESFQPELLIVDKEPAGVKGELLPALRSLQKSGARLICGFRDILDSPQKIAEEWARKGTLATLEEFYPEIFVYGEQAHFDFLAAYELPLNLAKRVQFTGYVHPHSEEEAIDFPFSRRRPLITFTLGGGGDGWESLELFLQIATDFPRDLNFAVLTGPFAQPALVQRAFAIAQTLPNFHVIEFTARPQALFRASDLVVSMGGYNSMVELLHGRKFPLVLPRVQPRAEQLIRAEVFEALGFCDFIPPATLSSSILREKVLATLAVDRQNLPELATRGLARIRQIVEALPCLLD